MTRGKIATVLFEYFFGDVAQLEEHHNGIVGVVGSNPIISTKKARQNKFLPGGVMVAQVILVHLVGVRISAGERRRKREYRPIEI